MESSPVPFDRLYAHRDWVRRVARALTTDESRASDLEQQVWLAAIERPPAEARSLRAWLGTVLRNTAGKMRRSDGRRVRREEGSAPRDAVPRPEEIVAETEAHERVVRAVLDLEEPYRSTVLLRYFEDLQPGEVAGRLGVPVETVRTRLRRALEQVRSRLDGEHGSRRAWLLLLLPLSRPDPSSAAGPVAAGGLVAASIGGLLMGTAAKCAVAGVVVVVAGLVLWNRLPAGAPGVAEPVAVAGLPSVPASAPASVAASKGVPAVVVPAPARATVDVVDAWSRPVAGAKILLRDLAGGPAAPASTDAGGRAVAGVSPAGRWILRVEAAGFATSETNLWILEEGNEPVRVILRSGYGLTGTVRDGAGRPVAGVVVAADSRRFSGSSTEASPSTAGIDGGFRLEGLRAGIHEISIRTRGGIVHHGATVHVPSVKSLDLRILGGVTFKGKVVDDGTGMALAGAEVTVEIQRAGAPPSGTGTATTGADGAFGLVDLPPGDGGIRVRARRDGYLTSPSPGANPRVVHGPVPRGSVWEREIRLVAGTDPSPSPPPGSATTGKPGSIEGVVLDPTGAPATRVSISIWTDSAMYGPGMAVVSDGEGRFHRDGVPAGRGSLYARPAGKGVGGTLPFTIVDGEDLRGLRIEMKSGGAISGRVRRSDGNPIDGPLLHATRGAFSPRAVDAELFIDDRSAVVIDPDGRFRLENLQAGTWCLAAEAKDCSAAAAPLVDLEEGDSKSDVEIVLDPALGLGGRVVDDEGGPVAGALVTGREDSYRHSRNAILGVTDADGMFRAAGFRAGPMKLLVTADGYMERERDVAAGTSDLVLILERAAGLSGRVFDGTSRKPIVGVTVMASPERSADGSLPPRGRWETVTDAEGGFRIDRVPEGRWSVTAGIGNTGETSDFRRSTVKGVQQGTSDIEILLTRGDRITGALVDESGAPFLESMSVHALKTGPNDQLRTAAEVRSSDDGTFTVGGLDEGVFDLWVRSSVGKGDATPPAVQIKGVRSGGEPVSITIPRGRRIRGKVENLPGPVGGGKGGWISVRASGESYWPGMTIHLDADGTFASEPLDSTRTYDLLARDFPGSMGALDGVRPGGEDVVLVLVQGNSLSGRVVDDEGNPVGAGVPITAWARKEGADMPGARASTETRSDGSFTVTGLGSFRFAIQSGGKGSGILESNSGEADGDGYAPGSRDIVLHVRRGLTLRGRLLDKGGKPAAGITVDFRENGDWLPGVRSGDDGSFEIRGLKPGTVKVFVEERNLGTFPAAGGDIEVRLP